MNNNNNHNQSGDKTTIVFLKIANTPKTQHQQYWIYFLNFQTERAGCVCVWQERGINGPTSSTEWKNKNGILADTFFTRN